MKFFRIYCLKPRLLFISARTGNVDMTITNFLEGAVPDYVPSSSSAPLDTSANSSRDDQLTFTNLSSSSLLSLQNDMSNSLDSTAPINLSAKSDTFSRSAADRMLSFHERKTHLIENAVRKYIEKFGLNAELDPYMNNSKKKSAGSSLASIIS